MIYILKLLINFRTAWRRNAKKVKARKIYNSLAGLSWHDTMRECYKQFAHLFNGNLIATNALASIIYRRLGYEKLAGFCV